MGRILKACICCLMVVASTSCADAKDDVLKALLSEHNRYRTERGLEPLTIDGRLCGYAQAHSESMASKGHLVHSSMSELAAFAGNGNVGENIAWAQKTESEVCEAWINSPGHRANMLSKRFKKVGFGVKEDERGRKYWCAVFAS